jgi:glycosyltransferase involved in cell wall biosynthesis
VKLIFDVRGLMAEEYADAEHWRAGSLPYRITKAMERRALAAADGVVTLTEKIWPLINQWPGLNGREVAHEVVPCCTDLQLFQFNSADRQRLRTELGLINSFVLVYSGSIDGWYLTEKMVEFFAYLRRRKQEAHFLWLTPGNHERIKSLMEHHNVEPASYTIRSVRPREVAAYLSASDAGIAFIKPCFSKLASSPTKYGEYLACGLPLVINAGIGDSDALITEEGAGVLIKEFTDAEYARAVAELEAGDPQATRDRAREIATRLFDVSRVGVDRYARLYRQVLDI